MATGIRYKQGDANSTPSTLLLIKKNEKKKKKYNWIMHHIFFSELLYHIVSTFKCIIEIFCRRRRKTQRFSTRSMHVMKRHFFMDKTINESVVFERFLIWNSIWSIKNSRRKATSGMITLQTMWTPYSVFYKLQQLTKEKGTSFY